MGQGEEREIRRVFVVDGGVERIPCEVDEELGDCGPVV